LTPREFSLKHDGFFRREDRAWEKVATLGLWVLGPWSKRQLTPAQLLGRREFVTLPTPPASPLEDARALELEKARVLARALAWARS
jgi:hypothetical protein